MPVDVTSAHNTAGTPPRTHSIFYTVLVNIITILYTSHFTVTPYHGQLIFAEAFVHTATAAEYCFAAKKKKLFGANKK